jgi:hypothetical protein
MTFPGEYEQKSDGGETRTAAPRGTGWRFVALGFVAGTLLAASVMAAWSAWGPAEWRALTITNATLEGSTVRIDYFSGSCLDGERASARVDAGRVAVVVEGRSAGTACIGTAVALQRTATLSLPTGSAGLPVVLSDGTQIGTAPSTNG